MDNDDRVPLMNEGGEMLSAGGSSKKVRDADQPDCCCYECCDCCYCDGMREQS